MNKKIVLIVIGGVIGTVLSRYIWKKTKWYKEGIEREKELDDKLDELTKNIMHEVDEEIKKKLDEEMREIEQIEKENLDLCWNSDLMNIKYKDKDGVIHDIDVWDTDQFRKVMSNKSNKLLFS